MSADLEARLRAACVGRPAKIPWPHRLLHEAAAELARLREDAERLDYLESESETEGLRNLRSGPFVSLFRRNTPITRADIDAARKESGT